MEPDNLILLSGWARNGLTDEQIAHNIGITRSTLYAWKKKYSDISDTLKRGKEITDILVENALLERAMGGKKTVRKAYKLRRVIYEDGKKVREEEYIEYAEEEIYIPPDTPAAIFWLKNRKPEEWRDKRVTENCLEYEDDGFLEALRADVQNGEEVDFVEE